MRHSLAAEQANHDELAHDRIAELCKLLECSPVTLVYAARRMKARLDSFEADQRDREQEADEQERADLARWAHTREVRPSENRCGEPCNCNGTSHPRGLGCL